MQPMRLITRKLLFLSMLTMLCTTIALPARAHELRIVGGGVYQIAFGWGIEEPVSAGVPNTLQFFANVFDPPGQTVTFAFLDRDVGDTVKVTAVPFRLDTDDVDSTNIAQVLAHIVDIFPPLTNFPRCDGDSEPECEEVGYQKAFTPPDAGAYGAFLVGKLKRHNHDGFVFPRKFFAETFVCGRGTQDPGNSEFECVE